MVHYLKKKVLVKNFEKVRGQPAVHGIVKIDKFSNRVTNKLEIRADV